MGQVEAGVGSDGAYKVQGEDWGWIGNGCTVSHRICLLGSHGMKKGKKRLQSKHTNLQGSLNGFSRTDSKINRFRIWQCPKTSRNSLWLL